MGLNPVSPIQIKRELQKHAMPSARVGSREAMHFDRLGRSVSQAIKQVMTIGVNLRPFAVTKGPICVSRFAIMELRSG
jgi:hypothetical protein